MTLEEFTPTLYARLVKRSPESKINVQSIYELNLSGLEDPNCEIVPIMIIAEVYERHELKSSFNKMYLWLDDKIIRIHFHAYVSLESGDFTVYEHRCI